MKHLVRAIDGENQWWKYVVVLFIALIIGQMVGAIPLVVAIAVAAAMNGGEIIVSQNNMDFAAYGIDPSLGLALMVIPFIVTLILAVLLVKYFHKRSLKDVVNGGRKFRWKRFWTGVSVWGGLIVLITVVGIFMEPENYEFRFDPVSLIPLVVVALIFLPIQSGTEEYIFRGYLAQGFAAWTKRPWLVILIPSLLFALMHGVNPEVKEHGFWVMMPHYFTMAVTFAIMAYLDDGIELAIGVHAVNNCLGAILITSKESIIQTPALFLQKEVDPPAEYWGLLFSMFVMVTVFAHIYRWNIRLLWRRNIEV